MSQTQDTDPFEPIEETMPDAVTWASAAAQDSLSDAYFDFFIDRTGKLLPAARRPAGKPLRVGVYPAGAAEAEAEAQDRTKRWLVEHLAALEGREADKFADPGEGEEDWRRVCREEAAGWIATLPAAAGEAAPPAAEFAVPPVAAQARDARPSLPARPDPFTGSPEQLRAMRPHVVNLSRGALSNDGLMQTTERDLEEMARAIVERCGAGGMTLMLYAHGGLTSEKYALASVWTYYRWWLEHGVYPVFFVWETGALETLWQIVAAKLPRTRAVTRDLWDVTTDPVVEAIAKAPGTLLWDAMKDCAHRASAEGGGAARFAEILARAADSRPFENVVAVGHSAGSIFHAWFLGELTGRGVAVGQLHLLAPAITHRLYAETLEKLDVATTMFALGREAERGDNCGGVYRKSLLYLVSRAFEPDENPEILGMEEFWREQFAGIGDAVWAPTGPGDGPAARSLSRSHGGFDNDPATMESVLRRIRAIPADKPVTPPFPKGEIAIGRELARPNFYGMPVGLFEQPAVPTLPAVCAEPIPARPNAGAGRRAALCIGNNSFGVGADLAGCIEDARVWAATLRGAGFAAETLEDASAAQMRERIGWYAAQCAPGDTLVIHISSHGTQIPDLDGDESRDEVFADALDEAVLGSDWQTGGLLVDDDWPDLLAARPGAHIVRFHDFCHAGRTTRMMLDPGRKVRSVRLKDTVVKRATDALAARAAGGAGSYGQDAGYLTFCACQPPQLAAEENGMGLFSRAATRLLAGQGAALSARALAEQIGAALAGEDQKPLIEGPDAMAVLPVFGAVR